ncbi:MAG: HAMP domain-containing histidine kinase [Saccharofermentans sp.]|nr:HAMP domain-containing histidine kinase [Saccharofermentans sp.]
MFIISFLVFTTIVVFAVLLFLSYENMYNNLVNEVALGTENTAFSVAEDIKSVIAPDPASFRYTMDNDGSANFSNSRIIERFINSQTYRAYGAIYLADIEGRVYCRSYYTESTDDILPTVSLDGGKTYLTDETALELITETSQGGDNYRQSKNAQLVTSMSCYRVTGTEYYVLVNNVETTFATREEYLYVIFFPAMIAMVIAVILYAVFVYMSLVPIKAISRAISKVAEGDLTVRVPRRYADNEDYTNFSVSSEFADMGKTVNNMIESLEHQERDREMFISSIAHDIRTPLTSINGFVTAMLDGTIPPEKTDHYLELIKQQAGRIRTLVTQMTEASSLSHVDTSMMETFNISEMINDIVDNLEAQLTDKNIQVIKSLDPGPGIDAYGESQQLCRVIINIITNAIKFTPTGGTIKISTLSDKRERKIWITVEDSGAGVEEAKRTRIFESFFKADPSRKVEGFGLGLYICKQILAGHEQTITCEEGTELGGAKFVFSFPFPPEEN